MEILSLDNINYSSFSKLDKEIELHTNSSREFSLDIASVAIKLNKKEIDTVKNQRLTINSFYKSVLDIFDAARSGRLPNYIFNILKGEELYGIDEEWLRELPAEVLSCPKFYRADNTSIGKIAEIECPAAMWGEYDLLRQHIETNENLEILGKTSSEVIVDQILADTNNIPRVLQLSDNISSPEGLKYIISKTANKIGYFGYSKDVSYTNINFIRAMTVPSLMSENFLHSRIKKCTQKELVFEFPPVNFFMQKSILAFPFMKETECFFDSEVSDLINPTTLILDKFLTIEGESVSIEEFSKRPRGSREYYLKYAGHNVMNSWGSMSVYLLSKCSSENCEKLLSNALNDSRSGKFWILQKSDNNKIFVSGYSRNGSIVKKNMNSLFRFYYSQRSLGGGVFLARDFYKVHGQSDTMIGLITM